MSRKRPRGFKGALSELNAEIRSVWRSKPGPNPSLSFDQLQDIFQRDKGKCRFCGTPLLFRHTVYKQEKIHFTFHTPLKNGGQVDLENVLTTCALCKSNRRPVNRNLQRLPSGSIVSDLIEQIAKQTHQLAWLENCKREEHLSQEPDANRIAELDKACLDCKSLKVHFKQELDDALAEMVDMMYYRPFKRAGDHMKFVQGKNTIAENVDKICHADLKTDVKKDCKAEVAESVEEIVSRGKYIILQPGNEDEDD